MGPLKGLWTLGTVPAVPDGEVSPGDKTQGDHTGDITTVTGMGPGAVAMAMERGWGARTAVNTDSRRGRTRMEGRRGGPPASPCSPLCLPHFTQHKRRQREGSLMEPFAA